jgi:dCTP deaminase
MSILGRSEILREIEAGNITIEPYDPQLVGPASVDLHLSNAFRVFVRLPRSVRVGDDVDFRSATKGMWVENDDVLILAPGETVLGMTSERIRLADNLCGWLEGRSRFARLGLLVHISASFMQPGIANHQVLEMSNFGPIPLEIKPGVAVCQFVFQRIEGTGHYSGVFQDQTPERFADG